MRNAGLPLGVNPPMANDTDCIEFTRIDEALVALATHALNAAERAGRSIVTAESCTGGLLAALLSEAPGAGAHLHGGFVVYSKAQKAAVLDVSADSLARWGAVANPWLGRWRKARYGTRQPISP